MKPAASLFLKTHFFPLTFLSPTTTTTKKLLFLPNPKHPLIPLSISITRFSSTNPNPNPISYGPSLHKGTAPASQPQNDAVLLFREDAFTRVFHLSALRVPSAHCSAIENRLRGHLLNWPRIRNIARVPGDDLDPELAALVNSQQEGEGEGEEEGHVSLQRRIYGQAEGDGVVLSPVLYREKLARTFNTRGFVKFRNLAKISRPPKRKKKKKEEEEEKGERRAGKNSFAAVEVVEEDEHEEGEGILGNLVGEEFGRKKWRGPTRLLLLDERYAGRGVEDLPEAIKVVCLFCFCEFCDSKHFAVAFYF